MAGAAQVGAFGGALRLNEPFDAQVNISLGNNIAGGAPSAQELAHIKRLFSRWPGEYFIKGFKNVINGHVVGQQNFEDELRTHISILSHFDIRDDAPDPIQASECRQYLLSIFSLSITNYRLQIGNAGISGTDVQGGLPNVYGGGGGAGGPPPFKYGIAMRKLGLMPHTLHENTKELSFTTLLQFCEKLNFLNLYANQNDLHAKNMLYNSRYSELNIIDFGLAHPPWTDNQIAATDANLLWNRGAHTCYVGMNTATPAQQNQRVGYVRDTILNEGRDFIISWLQYYKNNRHAGLAYNHPYSLQALNVGLPAANAMDVGDLEQRIRSILIELDTIRGATANSRREMNYRVNATNDMFFAAPCFFIHSFNIIPHGPADEDSLVSHHGVSNKSLFMLPSLVRTIMKLCMHPNPLMRPMPRTITRLFDKILKKPFHKIQMKYQPGGQASRVLATFENRIEGNIDYKINDIFTIDANVNTHINYWYPNGAPSRIFNQNYTIFVTLLYCLLHPANIANVYIHDYFWTITAFQATMGGAGGIVALFRDLERASLYAIKELFINNGESHLVKEEVRNLANDTAAWTAAGIIPAAVTQASLGF